MIDKIDMSNQLCEHNNICIWAGKKSQIKQTQRHDSSLAYSTKQLCMYIYAHALTGVNFLLVESLME